MHEWYGHSEPPLTAEQRDVSAALLNILKGDAGQRAIAAWHMGWKPAVDASGRSWMAPFLAELLSDPYSVVRYIAFRSLRQLPGFEDFEFDYTDSDESLRERVLKAKEHWQSQALETNKASLEILLDEDGSVMHERVRAIMSHRDNKPVDLLE